MLNTDWVIIKGIGVLLTAIMAFFGLKTVIKKEIKEEFKFRGEALQQEFKLKGELVQKEIDRLDRENEGLKLEIQRLEHLVDLKLPAKEHTLLCEMMQQEVSSIKDCVKKEFEILHSRMNKRRKTNGFAKTTKD